jgi:hypothetical protein
MKLLIVGILLTVIQTPAPPTKQTPNSATVKQASPAPSQTAPDTDLTKPSPEIPKPEYRGMVREIPPVIVVTPKKDFWDKLYIFLTIVLVLIGAGTLGGIWYQAVKTRDAAEATRDSAKAAQDSVKILERQTAATEMAATAARDNIEFFLNKERARLRVELEKLSLELEFDRVYIVDFRILIHGPTAAFITDAQCVAGVLPLQNINDTDYVPFMYKIIKIPDVVSPGSQPIETFAIFDADDLQIINEIKLDRLFVIMRGYIKYKDVFDTERETRFRYVWRYSSLVTVGELNRFGEWEKCGAAEDNLQT